MGKTVQKKRRGKREKRMKEREGEREGGDVFGFLSVVVEESKYEHPRIVCFFFFSFFFCFVFVSFVTCDSYYC